VAEASYTVAVIGPLTAARYNPAAGFVGAWPVPPPRGTEQNWLMSTDTRGTITANNRVMVKPSPTDAEVPWTGGARVRVHRLADGYCAWEGVSDAEGYYWPTGLEIGVEYYPIAIDLTRQHEVDAAGPVAAVERSAPVPQPWWLEV
jgi:hypothetical protein